jgi:hypothetical protein
MASPVLATFNLIAQRLLGTQKRDLVVRHLYRS